jgi:hypothetical protein
MTKKYHRRRNLKGGFLDSLGQTFSNLGTSISQGASTMWNKTKKATGMDNTSSTTSTYVPSSSSSSYTNSTASSAPTAPTSSTYSYGGKRVRKGTRKMKRSRAMKRGGNFSANTPIDSLASRASPFPRTLTARAHDLVGGKRRRTTRSKRSRR